MKAFHLTARGIVAATLLCAAAASQATVVSFTTLGSFAGSGRVTVDDFRDQTINSFAGPTLTRSVGSFGYEVTSSTGLFIAPVAGTIGLSTEQATDILGFSNFSAMGAPVYAFGANFFATNILGEAQGGSTAAILAATDISFEVVDVLGGRFTTTQAGNLSSRFMGFRSDVALFSVSARITNPESFSVDGVPVSLFVTADNVTFVPEPTSLMLVLAAGFAIPLVRARRRA